MRNIFKRAVLFPLCLSVTILSGCDLPFLPEKERGSIIIDPQIRFDSVLEEESGSDSSDGSKASDSAYGESYFPEEKTGEVKTVYVDETVHSRFYREFLSDEEQKFYDTMLRGILSYEEKIDIINADEEDISKVFKYIELDHPEIFWLTGSYKTVSYNLIAYKTISFQPVYRVSVSQIDTMLSELNEKINEIADLASQYETDFEKAVFVHDEIIHRCNYDTAVAESEDTYSLSYTAYSCLCLGKAVCSGYTASYQLILNKLGIACGSVEGKSGETQENHNWNYLVADGDYYYCDVTWDDPVVDEETSLLSHAYCLVTTEEILRDHSINDLASPFIPECTATTDNYYIKTGSYLEICDLEQINNIVLANYDKGMAEIKFATEELYYESIDYLITQGNFYNVASLSGLSLRYMQNDEGHILTIYF